MREKFSDLACLRGIFALCALCKTMRIAINIQNYIKQTPTYKIIKIRLAFFFGKSTHSKLEIKNANLITTFGPRVNAKFDSFRKLTFNF